MGGSSPSIERSTDTASSTRADHEHMLAGRVLRPRELPAAPDRLVTEEALDRIDADRRVELGAIARALAAVIADAPHHGGEGVVLDEMPPCGFVVARLGVEQ